MKKVIHLVLALCLVLSTLPAAFAAGGPSVTYQYLRGQAESAQLTVKDLSGPLYGVQLELELKGEYTASFRPHVTDAYQECKVGTNEGTTTVQIYLLPDSKGSATLGSGEEAILGTLSGIPQTALPTTAKITLLNSDLRPYGDAHNANVALNNGGTDTPTTPTPGTSPSASPSVTPSTSPSASPSVTPSVSPSTSPSTTPSASPSVSPSHRPSTGRPSGGGSSSGNTTRPSASPSPAPSAEPTPSAVPTTVPTSRPAMPYTDVRPNDWYVEAVSYMYENGMMTGTTATTFAPTQLVDRATIVTMLHRLEGTPAAGTAAFPDVASGQWYSAAVAWASANGVVTGYTNGTFGPGDGITREQLAAILYRYAQYKSFNTATSGSIAGFSDGSRVSGWAADAVQWAVGTGLITGKDGNRLDPAGSATRAEVATILMRFCTSFQ